MVDKGDLELFMPRGVSDVESEGRYSHGGEYCLLGGGVGGVGGGIGGWGERAIEPLTTFLRTTAWAKLTEKASV